MRAGAASLAVVASIATLSGRAAHACGVSASGTPGLCDATAILDEKATQAKDRIGVSYGYTTTVLFFSDDLRAPTERHVVMASYEHPLRGHWALSFSAGALLAGTLKLPNASLAFRPGVLAAASLSHLIAPPGAYTSPFLLMSFTLAGLYTETAPETAHANANANTTAYAAFDFNCSIVTGMALKTSNRKWTFTPYLAGRLFGGPVFWTHNQSSVLGTDAYKYSLGPGFAVSVFGSHLAFVIDGSLLGEKGLRVGVEMPL